MGNQFIIDSEQAKNPNIVEEKLSTNQKVIAYRI